MTVVRFALLKDWKAVGWAIPILISSGICASAVGAPANETVNLTAEATNSSSVFKKFVFSTAVPQTAIFTGMAGTLATRSDRASFGEMLMSIYTLPSGPCPTNGEADYSYAKIRDRYKGLVHLYSAILKDVASGGTTVPVNFKLPGGVLVSQCMFIILDGSLKMGGQYKMTAKVGLQFAPAVSNQHLATVDLGDEYCFGMERGCGPSHITGANQVFTHFSAITPIATQLASIQGNASSSPLTSDLVAQYSFKTVTGGWSVSNDLYVVPNCTAEDAGKSLVGNRIVSGGEPFSSVTVEGRGVRAVNVPLTANLSITLPKGSCIAHVSRKMGEGGVDAEYQAVLFTEAAKQTVRNGLGQIP